MKTYLYCFSIFCFFYFVTSCKTLSLYIPSKPTKITLSEYENLKKKLEKSYQEQDYYGIAYRILMLKGYRGKVFHYLKKAIENDSSHCTKIYAAQMLANREHYLAIYKYDTIVFRKVFDICLENLGADSFDLYMDNFEKEQQAYEQSLPKIDSTRMDTLLIKSLQVIYDDDQRHRKQAHLATSDEEEEKYWSLQNTLDSINLIKVDTILNMKGYADPEIVGNDLARTVFFVLHHQSDFEVRKKYQGIIEENYKGGLLEVYEKRTSEIERLNSYKD